MAINRVFKNCLIAGFFWVAVSLSLPALAQDPAAPPPEAVTLPVDSAAPAVDVSASAPELLMLNKIEQDIKEKLMNETYTLPPFQSLLFAPGQIDLLREARRGLKARPPSASELNGDGSTNSQTRTAAVRELALSGIVYKNADDWTIYLNKQRITPAAMPAEILNLKVYKDFIELKWFDYQTNKVYPIRLRPNQRFNIDARLFLPGAKNG